jgi:hypothetical protein
VERLNLFGYATRENLSDLAHGAQRGPTGAPNPATEWSSDVQDKATSFGLGGSFAVVKDKAELRLQAGYQKVDGNNDLTASVGTAQDIAGFDDTRIKSALDRLAGRPARGLRDRRLDAQRPHGIHARRLLPGRELRRLQRQGLLREAVVQLVKPALSRRA